jgi:hypothetical protein
MLRGVIEKFDSLSKKPVEEGYVPEHKIDFSHSINSEQKLTSDCNYCHKIPDTKVKLNLCVTCHDVNLTSIDKLDYYDKLDTISAFIRKFNPHFAFRNANSFRWLSEVLVINLIKN